MNQAGGGNWTHAISNDLIHWKHIQDTLGRGPSNSTWDRQGPCDGTLSFPNLGKAPYDGSVPIIMYGPDCTSSSTNVELENPRVGDTPRVEPATPKDPNDPNLAEWVKSQPGPVKFEDTPCSFPGRVWKSKVGNYWNMLCALNGQAPWARYTTTDPALMIWKMADASFTKGVDKTALAAPMFNKIPNAVSGGPSHMINANTGSAFYLGTYDSKREVMNVTSASLNIIDYGSAYQWAAVGTNGPDPETHTGRLLTVAWIVQPSHPHSGNAHLSLIREMSYDQKSNQLISYPVAEYSNLRNATFLEDEEFGPIAAGNLKTIPVPQDAGAAADLSVRFDVQQFEDTCSGFGVAVRANSTSVRDGAFAIVFDVTAPDAKGERVAKIYFSKQARVGQYKASVKVMPGESLDVRLLVDRPIVEVFIQGGRAALVYTDTFDPAKTSMHIFNHGTTPVLSGIKVSAYGMSCGWTDSMPKPISARGDTDFMV